MGEAVPAYGRRLQRPGRNDRLWPLAPFEVGTENRDPMQALRVDRVQFDRIPDVVVPDLVWKSSPTD